MYPGKIITKTIHINAQVSKTWDALTNLQSLKTWMSESEINILTDWKVGNPFLITGDLHGIKFENKGSVLKFEKEKLLSYNHLSSISELPDEIENYSVIEFYLSPIQNGTMLSLSLRGFPNEIILKHLDLYWSGTLVELKNFVENS